MNLFYIFKQLELKVLIKTTRRTKLYYSYPYLGFIDTIIICIFYDIIHRIDITELLDSKITFHIQGINLSNLNETEVTINFSFIFDNLQLPSQIQDKIQTLWVKNKLEVVKLTKIRVIIEHSPFLI